MTQVKCTVDSCEFWGEGQNCTADKIWVKNDITGDPDDFANHFINASPVEFSEEIGENLEDNNERSNEAKLQNETARTSPQTCCDTMRPKREDRVVIAANNFIASELNGFSKRFFKRG